ncbi:hypothetical protein ACIQM4_32020 [Streptomyces sp. NPDC091272]|uniref:hypothetical protein n=1 Tax=Streptomyces sp. NPDC091272 TaxID=3365981 RepID=UPI0037FE2B17
MPARERLRALAIVTGALAATTLPTVAAFAHTPQLPANVPHSTPREEIQPAAHIVGQLARRTAERFTGKPLGIVPEQPSRLIALKAPLPHPCSPN